MTDTDDLIERLRNFIDIFNTVLYAADHIESDQAKIAELERSGGALLHVLDSDRERIAELEREQTAWRKFTDEACSTLNKADTENESLRAQNKRYRDALERLGDDTWLTNPKKKGAKPENIHISRWFDEWDARCRYARKTSMEDE